MFERFTERARRALFFARFEVGKMGGTSVETEHLMLGLLREGKGLTSDVFSQADLALDTVRRQVQERHPPGDKVAPSVEIPVSPELRRVLLSSQEESERLQHNYIGTEHLLLGMLRERDSWSASLLTQRGIELESVRAEVQRRTGNADDS